LCATSAALNELIVSSINSARRSMSPISAQIAPINHRKLGLAIG
jgi:hypothetical protein